MGPGGIFKGGLGKIMGGAMSNGARGVAQAGKQAAVNMAKNAAKKAAAKAAVAIFTNPYVLAVIGILAFIIIIISTCFGANFAEASETGRAPEITDAVHQYYVDKANETVTPITSTDHSGIDEAQFKLAWAAMEAIDAYYFKSKADDGVKQAMFEGLKSIYEPTGSTAVIYDTYYTWTAKKQSDGSFEWELDHTDKIKRHKIEKAITWEGVFTRTYYTEPGGDPNTPVEPDGEPSSEDDVATTSRIWKFKQTSYTQEGSRLESYLKTIDPKTNANDIKALREIIYTFMRISPQNQNGLTLGSGALTTVGSVTSIDVTQYYQFNYSDPVKDSYGYGTTIKSSGCGPTCLAMVISSIGAQVDRKYDINNNGQFDPEDAARFCLDTPGARVEGQGTSGEIMCSAASRAFNVKVTRPRNAEEIIGELSNGNPIIASMGPGDFTSQGHFIVLRGVSADGTTILVNDPASEARTNKSWPISTIMSQAACGFWAFENKNKDSMPAGPASGAEGAFVVPLSNPYITQKFKGQYPSHSGIDYGIPKRTPVYATNDGTVEISEDLYGNQNEGYRSYGRYIVINHGPVNGQTVKSIYAHLDERLVEEGAVVKKGKVIGYSGNTGHSTGPHLHFGMFTGNVKNDSCGTAVDPETMFGQ